MTVLFSAALSVQVLQKSRKIRVLMLPPTMLGYNHDSMATILGATLTYVAVMKQRSTSFARALHVVDPNNAQ